MDTNITIPSDESSKTSTASHSNSVENSPNTEPPHREALPIVLALERYLAAIRGIGQTAQIALQHIAKWEISEVEKTQKKIEKFFPEITKEGDGPKTFTLDSARDFAEFSSTIRKLEELRNQNSTEILAKSLFTQLFAEFDAYIGELLKVIYLKDDKLLKGIARQISLSDLLDFDDLNAVKLSMLEKEIETFRRGSYVEQFSSLERKFDLSLRKFIEWPEFVELSQRRNILTHNGGMVSDQYLDVCTKEGHKFQSKPKIGDLLGVTFEYFVDAGRLLSKIGLMLAYTLWSKAFPKETDQIHSALNSTLFNCLQQKRWLFVAELEDYVLSAPMCKGISDIDFRIRIINTAIGLKFSGKNAETEHLLESVDWSASYRDFNLALAVLRERYDDAIVIMKSIGKTGEIIDQPDYHTWPLFARFRERPEFYEAYFDIYGEAFSEKVETTKGSVEAHAMSPDSGSAAKPERSVIEGVAREIPATSRRKKRSSSAKSNETKPPEIPAVRKRKASSPAANSTAR